MQKTNKMFGVTLLQLNVTDKKSDNVTNAMRHIRMTVEKDKPKMVVLPEMFTTPHGRRDLFEQNAELIPTGETCMMLSNIAKELKIYLVAGLPERDERDKNVLYNTTVVFKHTGDFVVKHRQVHLVDMDMMDMKMKESDFGISTTERPIDRVNYELKHGKFKNVHGKTYNSYNLQRFWHQFDWSPAVTTGSQYPGKVLLQACSLFVTAGSILTTFDMDGVKIGLGICCDLFYSEMATLYRKFGCDMMIYTTAYPRMMGEMFTDMLTKTRAADNQMFVMTISQARMEDRMKDMVYGHSLIVDGYGKVLKRLNDKEEMLYLDIDMTDLEKYRRDIKLMDHKRTDMYDLIYKK